MALALQAFERLPEDWCPRVMLCFLASIFGEQTVYLRLLNTSGMTGFIAWLGIAVCHDRFRRAWLAQGRDLAHDNSQPTNTAVAPDGGAVGTAVPVAAG